MNTQHPETLENRNVGDTQEIGGYSLHERKILIPICSQKINPVGPFWIYHLKELYAGFVGESHWHNGYQSHVPPLWSLYCMSSFSCSQLDSKVFSKYFLPCQRSTHDSNNYWKCPWMGYPMRFPLNLHEGKKTEHGSRKGDGVLDRDA